MADTIETELKWELRISKRARHARLQVKPYGGLEVVIPPRFPRYEIPKFVARHETWIREQLARQQQRWTAISLPYSIELACEDRRYAVSYCRPGEPLNYDLFATPADETLFIEGHHYADQIQSLRNWIRQRAWDLFPPILDRLSQRCQLPYCKLTIRSQKTRWGSCSRSGTISLNDQLLFMPLDTVEYLMIHELCHTRYLNHSGRFWHLVERHCADYRRHEERLRQADNRVPDWFTPIFREGLQNRTTLRNAIQRIIDGGRQDRNGCAAGLNPDLPVDLRCTECQMMALDTVHK